MTKALWDEVYQWAESHGYSFDNRGDGKAANHPVQFASWYDVVKWCNARSQQAGKKPVYYTDAGLTQVYRIGQVVPYVDWSAKGYRLPTEAQWEYACRAGSTTKYCCGDGQSELGDYAWNGTNSNNQTHQVGQKKSDAWGLYDMHGNAWEWCNDWYGGYANLAAVDPTGPSAGSERVSRGGCWRYDAGFCRSAYRGHIEPGYRDPYLGFRVSRVAE